MDPDLAARYQAQLMQKALEVAAFLFFTYVPLQVAAIWSMKKIGWKIVAGLPVVPILPVFILGIQPKTHRDGSLYGIMLTAVYGPAMICLALCLCAGLVARRPTTAHESSRRENDAAFESATTP